MRFEYNENKWELGITMYPETTKEAAQMLRIAKNAKAVKPMIYFQFGGDDPYLGISLEKVKEEKQSNSLNPADRLL
jgi:hypothetical protein